MMRDALLYDLSLLPYEVVSTVDARLPPPPYCHLITTIEPSADVWLIWENIIKTVDAVWLIAPETQGTLIALNQLAAQYNKIILGSGLAALKIATSKLETYKVLHQAAVHTVDTFTTQSWLQNNDGQWLIKPDDGAGSEGLFIFDDAMALQDWILDNKPNDSFIIQPYLNGVHGSISCIMHQGDAVLLSANTQIIHKVNNQLVYKGNIVNGQKTFWDEFELTAKQIAKAIPDLNGYVGIDVILETQTPKVIVIEINPRLTFSYCGLREAIGENPAKLVIDYVTQKNDVLPALQLQQVQVDMEQQSD